MIAVGADQSGAPMQILKDYEDETREELEARLGPPRRDAESGGGHRVP